jgi:hypothetical protein
LICLGGILKYANAKLFFLAKTPPKGAFGFCQSDDWPGAKELPLGILSEFRQIGRYDKSFFL